MKLELDLCRKWFTAKSTVGEISILGKHECFSLERPEGNNAPEISCVLEGTYDLKLYYSGHFQRIVPLLVNVPGRDLIEMHPANHPLQLKGCIAPGVVRGTDAVWSSDVAFEALFDKIQAAIQSGEGASITIRKEAA